MNFDRQLFKEAFKAGYKKAKQINESTMSNISITIKGVMIKPARKLYSNFVVFSIYVENGVPEEQIKAMLRVRLYETRPGDIIHDERYEDGYTSGFLAMLDLLTKESWSAHLIEVAWKMQKDNQEEIEEHHQI